MQDNKEKTSGLRSKNITLWVKINRCKLTYLIPVMGKLRCQELTWIVPDQINPSLQHTKRNDPIWTDPVVQSRFHQCHVDSV